MVKMKGKVRVLILPYKDFKHRIRLTKYYEKDYSIENMSGYLYMVRRNKRV
ncbi:hypothetical protein [Clostridium sporogenes]|uniref:hypothetical protein n=1 Tax=Clostridium sporogenes TaxID=1509 RepID=UPI001F24A6A1|nr:hypothetical protein [Clostridium sporogenes]UJA30880.1 hypothetical protein L0894_12235 [Clostridium sporogenes]